MTVAAAAGLVLLLATSAPACSGEQAPSFSLPSQSFPDIVAMAAERPADALKALESRRGGSPPIEADVLRARLLSTVGRHSESAAAWMAVAAAEPALSAFARRAAVRASLEAGEIDRADEVLAPL